MFYPEWLRVRTTLKVLAIVFGCLFAIAALLRIAFNEQISGTYSWVDQEMNKPGVRVTHERQSDGSMRTTIDDRSRGDHIVIVDRGWQGKTITITGPDVTVSRSRNVQIGSVGVHATRVSPTSNEVQVTTDEPVSARYLLLFASFVALIVATVLAGPLAKENTNHLEIAWTKAIGRERMALGLFGVDALAMLASMALTVIFLVLCTALFEIPHVVVDSATLPVLALTVFLPFAWYALLTACSSSLKRGLGAVIGLGWLAALVVPPIGQALAIAGNPLLHAAGVALSYVSLLDPLVYMHFSGSAAPGDSTSTFGDTFSLLASPPLLRAAILLALTVIYSSLSLLQWRRLEA
ncbi:MAG: hypothetical protein ACYC8W_09050 [Candidatus Tyrphobacter sp.]